MNTSPSPPAADDRADAETRARLLDLAYDIRSRLRHHAEPAVRISAALLLAASLAACSGDPADAPIPEDTIPAVAPLTQEVRAGLPTQPGRYPLVDGSLRRDERGVYQFSWREPDATSGAGNPAQASLLRLNESTGEFLEIPAEGDPVLNLRPNSQILLASATGVGTPTSGSGSGSSGGSYVYWRPFFIGSGYRGPAYYDPPARYMPQGATVDGARASSIPSAPAERTFGLARAVAGRAGGTGSGTAASLRSGAGVSSSSGGKSGVGAPHSSGFSSGSGSSSSSGGSS